MIFPSHTLGGISSREAGGAQARVKFGIDIATGMAVGSPPESIAHRGLKLGDTVLI